MWKPSPGNGTVVKYFKFNSQKIERFFIKQPSYGVDYHNLKLLTLLQLYVLYLACVNSKSNDLQREAQMSL